MGFLSKDKYQLNTIKHRDVNTPLILEVASLSDIDARIPKIHRKQIRNKTLTTYITPSGKSFRVTLHNTAHKEFIVRYGAMYSTSANKTGQKFEYDWALGQADVVVYEKEKLQEKQPSNIVKLYKTKQKRIR